ncbi:hypothetical protein ACJMK2_044428 [Sinanodonta woodiana]|uniref:Uncharacterized protein n=1 Tax=Sinanodonta woodiana TaxID=1069815 RepID=A0ABD3W3C5_SINWO
MSTIIDDSVWNTTRRPFMASGYGDFYVINMLSARVQEVMLTEDPDDEVSFSNLTAFLQNVCQNFTNGIYYMDENGQLSEKEGRPNTNPVDQITQEINDVRGNYLGNVLAGLSKLGVGRKRRQTLG